VNGEARRLAWVSQPTSQLTRTSHKRAQCEPVENRLAQSGPPGKGRYPPPASSPATLHALDPHAFARRREGAQAPTSVNNRHWTPFLLDGPTSSLLPSNNFAALHLAQSRHFKRAGLHRAPCLHTTLSSPPAPPVQCNPLALRLSRWFHQQRGKGGGRWAIRALFCEQQTKHHALLVWLPLIAVHPTPTPLCHRSHTGGFSQPSAGALSSRCLGWPSGWAEECRRGSADPS
jgi:hypothetical protein